MLSRFALGRSAAMHHRLVAGVTLAGALAMPLLAQEAAEDAVEFLPEARLEQGESPPSLLRAEQMLASRLDSYPRGGPDAIAGVGDWWLSNGILCAAISDVDHDAGIVSGGGSLVDLGYCDRDDDQWSYANFLTGLSKDTAIPVQRISAELGDEGAQIITLGQRDGLRQIVRYRLAEGSRALNVEVEISRYASGAPLRMSGLFSLYSQRALSPFSLSSYAPEATLGFAQKHIDRHNSASLINGLMPADWNIMVGSDAYEAGISYGVQLQSAELIMASGTRRSLPTFLAVFPDYSLHGWMSRPLWIQSERLNWLSMLQNQFMDLGQKERLLVRFKMLVGKRSDVAAVTDQIYLGPQLRGYSSDPQVSFSIWDRHERPLTQVRPDADGSFSVRLPDRAQRVRVEALTPWGQRKARELSVIDSRNDSGRWVFKRNGVLALPRGVAMSLYFFGVNGTPDPEFGSDLLEFSIDGEQLRNEDQGNRVDLGGVPSDPTTLNLPPGHYRVLVGRGIEYDVDEYLLTVVAGERSELPIRPPQRAWFSEHWRSADLHVHSGSSFDATLPLAERLRSFAAQGAELLVASEHNRIVDGRSAVAAMGLAERLQLIVGSELTGMAHTSAAPFTVGHSNAFPLQARPQEYAGGIPKVEGRSLRELIADIKARAPGALFQLNHPRSVAPLDRDLAFFEHLSVGREYDREQPLDSVANRSLLRVDPVSGLRDIDFDLLEVINGSEFAVYQAVRDDWFSLLNQGARRGATGNSDSHGRRQHVAMPRNYIYLPDAGPLPISESAMVQALAEGRSFMTTGPFMALTLRRDDQSSGIGDTFTGGRGELHIQLRSAPWVNVDRLTVWVNGRIYRQLRCAANDHKVVELLVDNDSWVVVEASGSAGERYRQLLPGLAPLALSNPIYMDADSDGQWRAPLN
ncbi:CehA/McbA family metallohydrolase [Spongiibacter sp.]|uniref:CehA/McbA family metallohydrolase n=1 Tax=Spongiibacter sp. TaxID=2024860 RepID=UPI0035632953